MLHHAERDADLAASQLAARLPLGLISFAATDARAPSYEEFMRREPPAADLPAPAPETPSVIFFASGSSGKPKGVTHTHHSFGAMLASIIGSLELNPADVVLPATSFSRIAATHFSLGGLAAGMRVDVPHRIDGDELLPLLLDTRPTLLCTLPSALFALVRDHGATHDHFPSPRLCVCGGDKVSGELEREFTALSGKTIDELYGIVGAMTHPPCAAACDATAAPYGRFPPLQWEQLAQATSCRTWNAYPSAAPRD